MSKRQRHHTIGTYGEGHKCQFFLPAIISKVLIAEFIHEISRENLACINNINEICISVVHTVIGIYGFNRYKLQTISDMRNYSIPLTGITL